MDRRPLRQQFRELPLPHSRTPSPTCELQSGVDLEELLQDALIEASPPQRLAHHQLVSPVLTIRPEANIETNVPPDLDLSKIIDEVESESEESSGSESKTEEGSESDTIIDTGSGCSDSESTEEVISKMENLAASPDRSKVKCKLVGGSKFYEAMDEEKQTASGLDTTPSPTEKQDDMKPTESDDEMSDVDQECTVFSGVSYLGAQNISDPKSESEIQRIMSELSSMLESRDGIAVAISVPICSQGVVVLYDAGTNSVMTRYEVKRILFYARGAAGSPVASCFAFTWSHGETRESAVYRCHVFRCYISEAVSQVSGCFAKAFERIPRSMASSVVGDLSAAPSMNNSLIETSGPAPPLQLMHVLECTLEIKELDAKGTFSHVPKERLGFKLRGGIDKQVTISIRQVTNKKNNDVDEDGQVPNGGLFIERCFGILMSPGHRVMDSPMRPLEMVSGSTDGANCSVCAFWNAGESSLAVFNVVSGDAAPVEMSFALDLVIKGVSEPVRVVVETSAKIYQPTEKFWYNARRPLIQEFYLTLKEGTNKQGDLVYNIASLETTGEVIDRSRMYLPLSLSSLLPSPQPSVPAPPSPYEPDSDGDEPLLSGTGEVSKDCCEDVLENWAQVLRGWTGPRPRALTNLVRSGVPEALRGEVWLRLADIDQTDPLIDTYRTLMNKSSSFEPVIQRDIARTFPAHVFFSESGGCGQESLMRVARAYAVYDTEVGYCQGLSFLAATLLLHMPEEQAFCLLVHLMYDYQLRELYKDGFDSLYLRLHQLDRLMEEKLTDLSDHFQYLGVESHMYASQWFLTVFTARFPLPLVYHIIDVFLLQGFDTLFQVALALLSHSRKDLLALDFEGILKYFRVAMPKKCRAEENAKKIIKQACGTKLRKLKDYQQDYEKFMKKAAEKQKINAELERQKEVAEQIQTLETSLNDARADAKQAYAMLKSQAKVAQEYKEICARMDGQLTRLQDVIKDCSRCSHKVGADGQQSEEIILSTNTNEESQQVSVEMALRQRIRELELELAEVKLAHVQAECNNQELSHQLSTALSEAESNQKNPNGSPWLFRTLGSLVEAAQNRPSFQTYLPNNNKDQPEILRRQGSFASQTNLERRVSEPYSPDSIRKKEHAKRHSMLEPTMTNPNIDKNRRSQDVTNLVKNISMG